VLDLRGRLLLLELIDRSIAYLDLPWLVYLVFPGLALWVQSKTKQMNDLVLFLALDDLVFCLILIISSTLHPLHHPSTILL
jgi:hypothetical protein